MSSDYYTESIDYYSAVCSVCNVVVGGGWMGCEGEGKTLYSALTTDFVKSCLYATEVRSEAKCAWCRPRRVKRMFCF